MFHPRRVLVLKINCDFLLVTTSVQWLNLLCIRNILTADVHNLFYKSRQKVCEIVLRTEIQNDTKWHTWMGKHKYFDNMLPRAVNAYSWFQPRSVGIAVAHHIWWRQCQNCTLSWQTDGMFCIAYWLISSQDKSVNTASFPKVQWKLSWVYTKRHLLERCLSL